MTQRCCSVLFVGPCLLSMAAQASEPPRRIFTYREAERARRLARQECTPLVIHFVPDSDVGAKQLDSFYGGPDSIPESVLSEVVVVVVPTKRYSGLARQLGITGPGGYRTISPFDLDTMDEKAQPTCRSGFV